MGRYQQATDLLQNSLDFYRETGDPTGEARALNGLGEILVATNQPEHARARSNAALGLTTRTGSQDEQARAHDGLARTYLTADPGLARRHWQEALTIYTSLGAPEADQVRARLE
jgi:tetratricopeptide (TPR) repeat protein